MPEEPNNRCECCQKEEAICPDYRPRPDLMLRKDFTQGCNTSLSSCLKFVVCDMCFKIESDLSFYKRMAKLNPKLLLSRLNSLGDNKLGEKGSPFLKLLKVIEL